MKPTYMVVRRHQGRERQTGFIYTREWYADYIAYRQARQEGDAILSVTRTAWLVRDTGDFYRVRPLTNTFPD